jgi:hypothetical protein
MQKVWHREFDGWWYATIRESGARKQLKLVKAPDTKDGKQLAEKQLIQELAVRNIPKDDGDSISAPAWATVSHILKAFLKHSREEHEPETAAWHERLLRLFGTMYGNLRYSRLRRKHHGYTT